MSSNELVDLVDNNGLVVRTAIPRAEAEKLNGEDLHIPIIGCVILNSSGEVLVHERATGKRFEGCLDHVYGAILSGESPQAAATRECSEELGIKPEISTLVREGINAYNYYQYLFAVITNDQPQNFSKGEVAWAKYMRPDQLKAGHDTREYLFTHNFFEDLEAVLSHE